METIKKQRKNLRTSFTKAHTAFVAKVTEGSRDEKIVAFQFLENKMSELDTVHAAYNKILFESTMTEEQITQEIETDDAYKTTYLAAKVKVCDLLERASERV